MKESVSNVSVKEPVSQTSILADYAVNLDHIAVAVPDLEASVDWYTNVMGFEFVERRKTEGRNTAMMSAVLKAGQITLVLVQGTSPESQVSRYIDHYGPGIQHVAIGVRDLPGLVERLKDAGMEFTTTVIQGTGIRQAFAEREPGSGMMFEFIERQEENGTFTDESVRELFRQLEEKNSF